MTRRIPGHERLERGHQGPGDPDPDQRTAQREHTKIAGIGEQNAANRRGRDEDGIDPRRAITIHADSDRRLGQTEREEIHAAQQAELPRVECQFGRQLRRDQRTDRAKRVRKKIPGGENEKNAYRGQSPGAVHSILKEERNRSMSAGLMSSGPPSQTSW